MCFVIQSCSNFSTLFIHLTIHILSHIICFLTFRPIFNLEDWRHVILLFCYSNRAHMSASASLMSLLIGSVCVCVCMFVYMSGGKLSDRSTLAQQLGVV